MKYHFVNAFTNTKPKIIHYPGPKINIKWEEICNYFSFKKWNCDAPKNLTIITFNNSTQKSLLENNLDALGLKHKVLGNLSSLWKNPNKIKLLVDFLPSVKTKYVLVLDAYDVLIVSKISKIIDEFLSFQSMILFNATQGTYPEEQNGFYCGLEKSITNDIFCHLNSGCFLGHTDYVRFLYNEVQKYEDEITKKYHYSDQIKIKKFYVERYPEIKIDSKCNIFQVLGWLNINNKDIDFDQFITLRPKML